MPKYRYRYYCKIIDFAPGREEDIIQQFSPAEGDIVIDVGANVGRYTILSSKMVGSKGKEFLHSKQIPGPIKEELAIEQVHKCNSPELRHAF